MFIPLPNFKIPGERKYPVYFSFGPADGFVTLEPQDLRSHLGELFSLRKLNAVQLSVERHSSWHAMMLRYLTPKLEQSLFVQYLFSHLLQLLSRTSFTYKYDWF